MSSILLTFLLFCACGFAAMYLSFAPQVRKYEQTSQFKVLMLPLLYIGLFYALGTTGVYFLTDNRDFIEPLTLMRVLLPLGLAAFIYMAWICCSELIFNILLACAVVILVWAQPVGQGTPIPTLPTWGIQISTMIIGFVFCRFYRIMNSTVQAFSIPLLMILLGIAVLSLLGAAPMFSALSAAVLLGILGAFLAINYHEIKIGLDDGSCATIAFLVFSLLVLQMGEFSFISCLMFGMVFGAELMTAVWYKYVMKNAGDLMANTNYYIAATKYSAPVLAMNIAKICMVGLFLSWFQIFSVNNYSMPFILLIIMLWLNHSFGRTDMNSSKKLGEINREFVADLKQNIQEAKDALNATKKEK